MSKVLCVRDFVTLAKNALRANSNGKEAIYAASCQVLDSHVSSGMTSVDFTVDWLRTVDDALHRLPSARRGNRQNVALLKAMLDSGYYSHEPFFDWAAKNIDSLSGTKHGDVWLTLALEDDHYSHMEIRKYHGYQGHDAWRLITFDCPAGFCHSVLSGYLDSLRRSDMQSSLLFFKRFVESFGMQPESFDDFTVKTLDRQIRWFDAHVNPGEARNKIRRHIAKFYIYIIDQLHDDQHQFTYRTGLTRNFLQYSRFTSLWLKGYRSVVFNPLDPIPSTPYWMLAPNNEERLKASYAGDEAHPVDLSMPDQRLQELLMKWAWSADLPSQARRRSPQVIKDFFAHRLGDDGSIPARDEQGRLRVSYAEVSRYLDAKRGVWNSSTLRHYRKWLSLFLRFGAKDGSLAVEPAALMLLDQRPRGIRDRNTFIDAADKEDMARLAGELERRASRSTDDLVVYTIFCMQSLTPLRITEILALQCSQISEGPRDGIHVISRTTKTSGLDSRRLVQLPPQLYRLLSYTMRMTRELAGQASSEVKDCVFLIHGIRGVSRCANPRWYRLQNQYACQALNIPSIAPQNVRKRYMTEVIEQSVKQHISRYLTKPLTGHSSLQSDQCYLREDERLYLEALYGIEIGVPNIRGTVSRELTPDIDPHKDLVQEGTGYCRNPHCDVNGTLPCWLCPFFYTTPDNISEMKQAADNLKQLIGSGNGVHDDDHYRSVLRLVLAYIAKMIETKEKSDARRSVQTH